MYCTSSTETQYQDFTTPENYEREEKERERMQTHSLSIEEVKIAQKNLQDVIDQAAQTPDSFDYNSLDQAVKKFWEPTTAPDWLPMEMRLDWYVPNDEEKHNVARSIASQQLAVFVFATAAAKGHPLAITSFAHAIEVIDNTTWRVILLQNSKTSIKPSDILIAICEANRHGHKQYYKQLFLAALDTQKPYHTLTTIMSDNPHWLTYLANNPDYLGFKYISQTEIRNDRKFLVRAAIRLSYNNCHDMLKADTTWITAMYNNHEYLASKTLRKLLDTIATDPSYTGPRLHLLKLILHHEIMAKHIGKIMKKSKTLVKKLNTCLKSLNAIEKKAILFIQPHTLIILEASITKYLDAQTANTCRQAIHSTAITGMANLDEDEWQETLSKHGQSIISLLKQYIANMKNNHIFSQVSACPIKLARRETCHRELVGILIKLTAEQLYEVSHTLTEEIQDIRTFMQTQSDNRELYEQLNQALQAAQTSSGKANTSNDNTNHPGPKP